MSEPTTIGTETAVKLATVSPEAAQAFSEMANNHRPVPVRYRIRDENGERWGPDRQECGAHGCGPVWPCQTRQLLDTIDALVGEKDPA